MLRRKAAEEFKAWRGQRGTRALLVTGARQVGKTFLVKEFLSQEYKHVVTFDLVKQPDVLAAFNAAKNADELFMAISVYAGANLVPHETVIFIDEVQKCKEALTAIKYLLEHEEYDFALTGSLLGVELRSIRSLPVGSLRIVDMYPLDFEEFCWACGVGDDALSMVHTCFAQRKSVPAAVHERMLTLFHQYLMVGGMPDAVSEFIAMQNLSEVKSIQDDIMRLYREDIAQYAPDASKLVIREIFDQIPSQLNSQSKRFKFSTVAPRGTYERYQAEFLWVVDAGVALPVVSVAEPRHPLKLSEGRNYFKLFLDDVGLLSAVCGIDVIKSILSDELGVNFGSIYENAIAQELHAHGYPLHYFRSKKFGEVDFLVEKDGGSVLPIEVKSGKNYKRHSALNSILDSDNYTINQAVVLCEENITQDGKILYCPVYMSMCI